MPRVSVLMPMYDAQATLAAALESLQRQVMTDWECVLCDDGSRDRTREIATAYAERDARFTVFRRDHQGLISTLNWGLLQCHANYVARLDADDVAHRERLALQYRFVCDHPEYAGVGCGVRMFPRSKLTAGRKEYETWLNDIAGEQDILRNRFVECPLAHPAWLIKRDVLTALGYRDRAWPEDYDLLLRLLGAGHRLSTVNRRLLFWRDSATRLSRTHAAYQQESFTRCRAHFLAADWLQDAPCYGLWGYGSTGRHLARALAELGKRPAYIVELHPRRIGQRIMGVPVIAPEAIASTRAPQTKLIISVSGQRNREDARRIAQSIALVENVDFVCAA